MHLVKAKGLRLPVYLSVRPDTAISPSTLSQAAFFMYFTLTMYERLACQGNVFSRQHCGCHPIPDKERNVAFDHGLDGSRTSFIPKGVGALSVLFSYIPSAVPFFGLPLPKNFAAALTKNREPSATPAL